MAKSTLKRVSVYMNPFLYERVKRLSMHKHISISTLLQLAIEKVLKELGE